MAQPTAWQRELKPPGPDPEQADERLYARVEGSKAPSKRETRDGEPEPCKRLMTTYHKARLSPR